MTISNKIAACLLNLIVLFGLSSVSFAAPPVVLVDGKEVYPLGLHLDILFALIGLLSRIGLSGLLGKLGGRQRRMFLDGATDVHLEV